MNPTRRLHDLGQCLRLDDITRRRELAAAGARPPRLLDCVAARSEALAAGAGDRR